MQFILLLYRGADLFKKYNGETALHMIMKKCSSSEGIIKCLDNCLKKADIVDKDISNDMPDWGIDFSFLIDQIPQITGRKRKSNQ